MYPLPCCYYSVTSAIKQLAWFAIRSLLITVVNCEMWFNYAESVRLFLTTLLCWKLLYRYLSNRKNTGKQPLPPHPTNNPTFYNKLFSHMPFPHKTRIFWVFFVLGKLSAVWFCFSTLLLKWTFLKLQCTVTPYPIETIQETAPPHPSFYNILFFHFSKDLRKLNAIWFCFSKF